MRHLLKCRRVGTFAFACALLFSLVGCGGGGGSTPIVGTGTLAVHLADGAGSDITACNVTVTRIDAHASSGWFTVYTGSYSVNLLDLRNADAIIGSALVPATSYSQVRLFVQDCTVTDSTGTHPVTIPSALQSGIKINLHCSIPADVVTAILLDFDVAKSFVKQGNGTYLLKPVIPAVVQTLSGTVTGTVVNSEGVVNGALVKAVYTDGGSYASGTEVNSTASQADGTFKVWALLPGTYTFTFAYTNPVTTLPETATVTGVVVTANANTDVGTVTIAPSLVGSL